MTDSSTSDPQDAGQEADDGSEPEVTPVPQRVLPFIVKESLEQFLSEIGTSFRKDPLAKLAGLVRIEESQVRAGRNRAPKEQVTIYATKLANGATFPPIVICEIKQGNGHVQRILVDGNTRASSANRLRWETFPAYVVQCKSADEMHLIATFLNGENGNPMEKEEALASAGRLLMEGHSAQQVARLTGYEANYVRKLQREIEFEERRQALGLEVAVDVSRNQKAAVARAAKLEPVFIALTKLVSDSNMKAADIDKLGTAIGTARSQEEQIQLINDARTDTDTAERIRKREQGIVGPLRPSLPAMLAMHVGWIFKQTPSQLVDYDPSRRTKTVMQIRQAILVLQQLLAAYGEETDSEESEQSA